MSFGVVQSMIISLRNNSRKKDLVHFERKNFPTKSSEGEFDKLLKRKASPEELKRIRAKIKKQQRKLLLITIIISSFILLTLILGLVLFLG